MSELCLLATGGLLALRAFYLKIEIANETSEKKNENRLRELKYATGNNGRSCFKVGASKFSNKARTIQLVWKHFNSTRKCYKLAKPRDGGGTRSLKIKNATKKELLESAKQLFCIKNKIKFGFDFNLRFELAILSEEIIIEIQILMVSNTHLH